MNASLKKKFTSLFLVWAMVVAPVLPVYAQTTTTTTPTTTTTATPAGTLDFNTYCGPAAIAADPTAASDQTNAYCAQASTAETAIKFQTMKEVLMMASGATLTALAFVPLGQGAACKIDSNVADVAGLGLDVAQSIKTSSLSTAMMSGISSIGSLAITNQIMIGKGIENSLSNSIGKVDGSTGDNPDCPAAICADTKKTNPNAAQRDTCLMDAALAFAQGAVSMLSVSMQKKAEQSALQSVAALIASRSPGTSSFNLAGNSGSNSSGSSGTAANAVAAPATSVQGTCAGTGGGSAYLSCLSKGDPVSAALTSNPDAMNAMDQALGQPTAGFVQGYTGDGSPASVAAAIGGAMGLSPTGTAALQKAMDTAADIAAKDYKPATYMANNAPAAAAGGDADFGKMMSGMMNKLVPDASKGEDPSTIVYRQLDLLPANKIEANKDISLFARIGYRYRKSSGDVEQLNWSNPANQTVNNAPIGGATTAPTTTSTNATANSGARTPASKN